MTGLGLTGTDRPTSLPDAGIRSSPGSGRNSFRRLEADNAPPISMALTRVVSRRFSRPPIRPSLDAVLDDERGWRELTVPTRSLMVFRHRDVMDYSIKPFEFVAHARRRKTAPPEEAP